MFGVPPLSPYTWRTKFGAPPLLSCGASNPPHLYQGAYPVILQGRHPESRKPPGHPGCREGERLRWHRSQLELEALLTDTQRTVTNTG